MTNYLKQIEPVDVRYLIDLKEVKDIVADMLGEGNSVVSIRVSYDETDDETGAELIRPMVELEEISGLTEADRHAVLSSGLNLDAPFDNGDQVFRTIFGPSHVITAATEDEDGSFFTVEVPYEEYRNL
ncbi:hypothetical protein [Salimicrobium halophilum]|uniref:Uncharacterized protein n=1 Tax=Salimicrobium halophilum TaxID=86666 RepID=A0A1G8U883_9BACI|nr:hypothetical protein [Salimicrobium halophilum]SDJ49933.1 hypothetical protein SAMN04490247_2101 [Salimicrobium halophilum]